MGELVWPERVLVGCLSGLGLAMYVVAWNQDWNGTHSSMAVGVLTVFAAGLLVVIGSATRWRAAILLACAFLISTALLTMFHYDDEPFWLRRLPAAPGGDAVLWQVHTTFLSVGFAGLAIAAQLFAEAPLAMGASRDRVLKYIRAGWFAGVGLVANALMAVETIWLHSDLGVLAITVFGFVPTVVLLLLSTIRLMQLFGHPSRLDEVVRVSLVETLASRLDIVSRTYAAARTQLDGLFAAEHAVGGLGQSAVTFNVPVPREGVVIRAIKPQIVRRAMASIQPRATEDDMGDSGIGDLYTPAQITLGVEPGDRTRLGETAFRVTTTPALDRGAQERLRRMLQSSIQFEAPGAVTPYEETDREIANLKDTIGTSLRAGAYSTAERALELLGEVVRGVWMARPESLDSSRRSSFTRRDWLFRSIGEAEQDVTLSRRAADLFVGQAMTRALEAPRTGSTEYVDDCLRSFTRLWYDVLRQRDTEFESLPPRITICVQNLASYAYSTVEQAEDLQARATWAMVELIKLALDARNPEAALLAARELSGLFEYVDRHGNGRAHVRAGQLVLSGWLDYLADKRDERDPDNAELRALVTPRGNWSDILFARTLAERGVAPFSRWDWWEMKTTGSGSAQVLELSHYIDRAELAALANSYGPLPPANDQETASEYGRFLRLLTESHRELSPSESNLKRRFTEEIGKWEAVEDDRLAREPLSQDKIAALKTALRETLDSEHRLAAEIPTVTDIPEGVDASHPILGMNFRVPRHYLVDKIFNQTYANPEELGRMIARGFKEGEERKIVGELQSYDNNVLNPTVEAIRQKIDGLGKDARHYVLVTPYGGAFDLENWYSLEFRESVSRVTRIETAALENEAILFDRRNALISCRHADEKNGLALVEGTSLALGVFEDVQGEEEPQVRIKSGEFFVVWRGEAPRIFRFAVPADR